MPGICFPCMHAGLESICDGQTPCQICRRDGYQICEQIPFYSRPSNSTPTSESLPIEQPDPFSFLAIPESLPIEQPDPFSFLAIPDASIDTTPSLERTRKLHTPPGFEGYKQSLGLLENWKDIGQTPLHIENPNLWPENRPGRRDFLHFERDERSLEQSTAWKSASQSQSYLTKNNTTSERSVEAVAAPKNNRYKRQDLLEGILEKDYDLPEHEATLSAEEKRLLSFGTWGTFRCEHPSCWDRQDKFRFKEFAELARHYQDAHPSTIAPETYPCDYDLCKRSDDPFTRKDAYRDHLREYHLEDMAKRHKNPAREKEWLAQRVVSLKWWRCVRCLIRVEIGSSSWACPTCEMGCEEERIAIRRGYNEVLPLSQEKYYHIRAGRVKTIDGGHDQSSNTLPNSLPSTSDQLVDNHCSADTSQDPETLPSVTRHHDLDEKLTIANEHAKVALDTMRALLQATNPVMDVRYSPIAFSHVEYNSHNSVPYKSIKQLGHGSLGSVDAVRGVEGSENVFARKVIRIPNMARKRLLPLIQQEVAVLRELKHKHIIEIISTYETTSVPRLFGIILSPAGNEDLSHFLERVGEDEFPEEDLLSLKRWLSCLASAIAYIHSQNVRHKDIKPSNAICKDGDIFLTDFGSAHQFSAGLTSSTEGYAIGITRMYSAPEVISLDKRGRPADVFSLGCVFAEMATVMGGRKIEDFHEFRSEPVPDEPDQMTLCYYATAHKLGEWFAEDDSPWICSLISDMTIEDQNLRPTADEVLSILVERSITQNCSCSSSSQSLQGFMIQADSHLPDL